MWGGGDLKKKLLGDGPLPQPGVCANEEDLPGAIAKYFNILLQTFLFVVNS